MLDGGGTIPDTAKTIIPGLRRTWRKIQGISRGIARVIRSMFKKTGMRRSVGTGRRESILIYKPS